MSKIPADEETSNSEQTLFEDFCNDLEETTLSGILDGNSYSYPSLSSGLSISGSASPISNIAIGNYTFGSTYAVDTHKTVFNSDVNVNGDFMVGGRSLMTILDGIEKRLSILQPDPKKLEAYAALQKAYAHYKTLEALFDTPPEKDD